MNPTECPCSACHATRLYRDQFIISITNAEETPVLNPTPKFAVGDRVKITSGHPSPSSQSPYIGAFGTVTRVQSDGNSKAAYKVELEPGQTVTGPHPSYPKGYRLQGTFTYFEREIEAAPRHRFAVGDWVRVKAGVATAAWKRATGRVTKINEGSSYPYHVTFKASGDTVAWAEYELEPALKSILTASGPLFTDRTVPAALAADTLFTGGPWKEVGGVADGLFTAPIGTPPPTPKSLRGSSTVSFWADEVKQLEEPRSIPITPGMRRRGITTEADTEALEDRANRAEVAAAAARLERNRAQYTLGQVKQGRANAIDRMTRAETKVTALTSSLSAAEAERDLARKERDQLKQQVESLKGARDREGQAADYWFSRARKNSLERYDARMDLVKARQELAKVKAENDRIKDSFWLLRRLGL